MSRTRIKICGVTSLEAARAAIDAGADAIGCVFADGSPRRITIDVAAEIVSILPPMVSAFGVFQLNNHSNAISSDLEQWMRMSPFVQLHGEEDEQTAKRIARKGRVIKAFPFASAQVRRWDGCPHIQMLLIDSATPGSGKRFNYEKLVSIKNSIDKPIILAGGLNAESVGDAVRAVRPFAVDVSSGVESAPGAKDAKRIEAFCAAVRDADASGEPVNAETRRRGDVERESR